MAGVSEQIRTMSRVQFQNLAERCKMLGLDLAEAMERSGAILTPERLAKIRHNLYLEIAQMIDETSASQWTSGNTQADLMRGFSEAMRRFAREELS